VGKSKVYLVIRSSHDGDPSSENIYHIACLSANPKMVKFVKHLFKALPEELTHELMAQTSTDTFNTVQTLSFSLMSCCSLVIGTVPAFDGGREAMAHHEYPSHPGFWG
jgi:hypothetical protein